MARSGSSGEIEGLARRPDLDRLAGCDGLDQSWTLGQSPRTLRPRNAMSDPPSDDERIPSTQNGASRRRGSTSELGIAEMNLFLLLGRRRLQPLAVRPAVATDQDGLRPFIARGLDALNYACYHGQPVHDRRHAVGCHTGARGGAHQSIGSPLIGISQDGLTSFGAGLSGSNCRSSWIGVRPTCNAVAATAIRMNAPGCAMKPAGAVYLRLSTRAFGSGFSAPGRRVPAKHRRRVFRVKPGPKRGDRDRLSGCVALPEASRPGVSWGPARYRRAGHHLAADHSACRLDGGKACPRSGRFYNGQGLSSGWSKAHTALRHDHRDRRASADVGLAGFGRRPQGHYRSASRHFGQTGSVSDLYRHWHRYRSHRRCGGPIVGGAADSPAFGP